MAEESELAFFGAGGVRGIIESPMVTIALAGKHRASLIGAAADGDHGFDRALEEFRKVLRTMFGNVEADFAHDFDRERVDEADGFAAGAGDLETAFRRSLQE